MEYFDGQTLSRCTREKLTLALDALIELQNAWWQDTTRADAGLSFERCYESRQKWLPHMADLTEAFGAYLEAFCTMPRTLCNDDLLPFNVLSDGQLAVIIDWEYGGILPYPCALARLIAYGEDREDALFYMTQEDKEFALRYYYDRFIRHKGITWEEYSRTMELFLLKEYAEWVYCAHKSGDLGIPYYKPYYAKACTMAAQLKGEAP
jgi:thiamine kinase-like enzyme